MKKNKSKKKFAPSTIAAIASVFVMVGLFFILNNFAYSKKIRAYDYMANVFYTSNIKEEKEENPQATPEENKQEANKPTENTENQVSYIGYLDIPKINVKKGFLDKNDKNNNVDINLYVSPISNYPDADKGNLVIAGHSGANWNAFFHNLYKVNKGDYVYVTYKNKKYTYQINNIYKQNKTGTITIYRNYEKTTLTLVTCTNNDDTTQTVYIAYLTDTSEI